MMVDSGYLIQAHILDHFTLDKDMNKEMVEIFVACPGAASIW